MAYTDPANLIDPQILADYANAMYSKSNAFVNAGLVTSIGGMESGNTLTYPTWEVVGDMQNLVPGNDLTSRDLDDHSERHPIVRLYNQVLNLDVAGLQVKGDPNAEAARQVAENTKIGWNKNIIACMQGSTAANTANVVADTSAAFKATDITSLEAVFGDLIGTVRGQGAALVMNSGIYNVIRNLSLIADPTTGDRLQDDLVATGSLGSINGYSIIIEDELYRAGLTSKTSGDALTYLVAKGAMNSATQKPLAVEWTRDEDKQAMKLTWSIHNSIGVKGMDYTASVTAKGALESELKNSSNYSLVAESAKFVKIASIQTNAG